MSRTFETQNRAKNWWIWSEPKAWRRTFKHKKRRAELKRALLNTNYDNATYPLDKKPWIYYW